MVQLDRSPLGQLLYEPDRHKLIAQFQQDRRFIGLTTDTIQQSLDCLARDEHLRTTSGRWMPGQPDPEEFVPGDVAAVRVGAGKPILISGWRADAHGNTLQVFFERSDLLHHPMKALDLVDLTGAVPYFIPTAAALGVLASRPPDQQLQQQLRLPFDRVFVLFGADLELDPSLYPWPADYPYQQLPRHSITYQMIDRGGFVSGVVLLADQDGHLRDDLLWIVAANPDPSLPPPANLDRIRGVVRGWRSAATLGPLVTNIAAAVAWGAWQPPTTPLQLPTDPTSKQWRNAVKRGAFRRREPRGDAVGVHVLDLSRTTTLAHHVPASLPRALASSRNSPIPHLRGGHFRRVRVGPRSDWHYQVRWIAPSLVRGDQPSGDRLVVRRLPPPTWLHARDQSGEGILTQQGTLGTGSAPPSVRRMPDPGVAPTPGLHELPSGPDDPRPLSIQWP